MIFRTSGYSSQLPFHVLPSGGHLIANRNMKQQAEESLVFSMYMDFLIFTLPTINVLSVKVLHRNSIHNITCSSYYVYIIIYLFIYLI